MARRKKTETEMAPSSHKILNLEVEDVPVEHLVPHPKNPNVGDLSAIMASIRVHGFWNRVTANKRNRRILAGNHRFEAAKQLGYTNIPVQWVDVDEETELRILTADNRTSRLGDDDPEVLAEILTGLMDTDTGLDGLGYTDTDVDRLIASLAKEPSDAERAKDPKGAAADYNAAIHGREIHLAYTLDEYNEMIGWLEALVAQRGCDSYSELLYKLVAEVAP